MNSHFDVQFWSIRKRANRRKPWEVRWRVGDRPQSRSFTTRAHADTYRSNLIKAARAGEEFSPVTGEPVKWGRAQASFYALARELVADKWPGTASNTRKQLAESLAVCVLAALDPRKANRNRPDGRLLRRALKQYAFVRSSWGAEPDDVRDALTWIENASLPVSALEDAQTLDRVLSGMAVAVNGKPYGDNSVRHHRTALYMACGLAVVREMLDANPLDRLRGRRKGKPIDRAVDPRTVPTQDQHRRIMAAVPDAHRYGPRLAALYETIYYAGCRPAEVIGLREADATLPATGWGQLILSGGVTDLGGDGQRFNDDGQRHEQRELKHRGAGSVRIVPIPPYLVRVLLLHMTRFPAAPDGRLFYLDDYAPVDGPTYRRVWKNARKAALTSAELACKLAQRVYDLRHGNASLLLGLRVPPGEVARRLGHSIEMLFRVYAHWLTDQVDYANDLIDTALTNLPLPELPQVNDTPGDGPDTGQTDLPDAA